MKYKYMSGIEVMEGDVVAIRRGNRFVEGVVLQVLLPNTPDADAWSSPDGGVLIEGAGLGLSVTESLENDEDVVLVRRASRKP
ncbi:MAG: hypothetical protein IPM54_20285 [Polyangiaceae bacterium]|nr:hypothetical protein [Polyangiaceae bacterium]